jgi:hypothetical protein
VDSESSSIHEHSSFWIHIDRTAGGDCHLAILAAMLLPALASAKRKAQVKT